MCQRKGCTARATADVNGEQLCPWHSLGYVMDAPRPAAPAKPYKFDGPIKTTRPCAVCRDRLAWFDGNTCGPCAGTDRPTEIVLGGTESGVDASDLFPGVRRELAGPRSLTTLDIWRQQAREESDERERLIKEYLNRE